MFTSVFRDRTLPRGDAHAAAQALDELLQSRVLRPHRFSRNCEIGPFIVEHVCRERLLIVELQPRWISLQRLRAPAQQQQLARQQRHAARVAFLNKMGYVVLVVSSRQLLSRPGRVLEKIRAALTSEG